MSTEVAFTLLKDFSEVPTPALASFLSSAEVRLTKPVLPHQLLMFYSPDEWELFINEWVHAQRSKYIQVLRFTGAGDMGIDVAGFVDEHGLLGIWENYQCKHYHEPLTPGTAAAEVGKTLWYSFKKEYAPPRAYYFVAPRECGTTLKRLLMKPDALKRHVTENWEKQCSKKLTSKQTVFLDGEFATYVDGFDFSIFRMRTTLEIVDEHRATPYYSLRFKQELEPRPKAAPPPNEIGLSESRYVEQLYEAYGDHLKATVARLDDLSMRTDLVDHFHRQREAFYHAEALRNFARDTVPPGTFEDLQSEVHAGVIEDEAAPHPDGLARLTSVLKSATAIHLTGNPLISRLHIQDRKGICHQLASADRLRWRKP